MKSKLLPLVLLILILLNGVLIFVLIKKPYQNKKNQSERIFLVEELEFSDKQKKSFTILDEKHKVRMNKISHDIRLQKDMLFNSFGDININLDSLVAVTGQLEAKKELEIFKFFKSVRKICTTKQQVKFDEIINKAIRGAKNGPPRKGEHYPPGGNRIPQPPR